jgi:hypothetical protein
MMHVKHLGTDMYYYGSILWLLIYAILSNTPEVNLCTVWGAISGYYSHNRVVDTFRNMKLSMFTDPAAPRNTYPKLKGRAAEVKRLGPALLHVWERWGNAGDRIHQQVRAGLRHSIR